MGVIVERAAGVTRPRGDHAPPRAYPRLAATASGPGLIPIQPPPRLMGKDGLRAGDGLQEGRARVGVLLHAGKQGPPQIGKCLPGHVGEVVAEGGLPEQRRRLAGRPQKRLGGAERGDGRIVRLAARPRRDLPGRPRRPGAEDILEGAILLDPEVVAEAA